MNKIKWIKDLVIADQEKLDGSSEASFLELPERQLDQETISFLKDLRFAFIEAASVFNQMKGSSIGNLKIYSISKTEADFMLFRNHLKLSFIKKQPGLVDVCFRRIGENALGSSLSFSETSKTGTSTIEEPSESLNAQPGAFGEFHWFCRGYAINMDYLVRYYLRVFVQRSSLKGGEEVS